MGLLNRILSFHQQKQIERNERCCESISDITAANLSMEKMLNENSGFIYDYTYKHLLKGWNQLVDDIPSIARQLRKADSYCEWQNQFQIFLTALNEFTSSISTHNKTYLNKAIDDAYRKIGNVEGRPLDRQQMECIVKDAPNHLVVAGAGTGKTTTIIGKVKLLLATEACKADEILVLSFTNAAANEMKTRLIQETNLEVLVETFHKLGLDIIRKCENKVPLIYSESVGKFAFEQIRCRLEESWYAALLMRYLLFRRISQKSEFDFDTESAYRDYLDTNPPTTIKGEVVKSYGEMEIANFLAQFMIEYRYEELYKFDTRTEEFAQYKPDFYLPKYDIYIEYYGINKQGEVPSFFSGKNGKTASEAYRESIAWKEKVRRENGTTLIECYAYEKFDGVLLDNLKMNLQKHGVPLEPIEVDQLFSQMIVGKDKILDGLAELFQTILSLARETSNPDGKDGPPK